MKTSLFFAILLLHSCTGASDQAATPSAFDETKEKAAIMETIRQETECFYKGDYECWKQTYVQADYAFQAWNNADGTSDAKTGWKEVDEKIGKYIRENIQPTGGNVHPKVEKRNMIVKFFGPAAVYMTWDQYNISRDLKTYRYSKETRVMEKIGGQWKIVSVAAFWDYKNIVSVDSLK